MLTYMHRCDGTVSPTERALGWQRTRIVGLKRDEAGPPIRLALTCWRALEASLVRRSPWRSEWLDDSANSEA